MRLRDLEQALQRVRPFDTKLQKIDLEQFPTGFHIASRLVLSAAENDDVEGCVVADLGTGTGMLGIGCALMGASAVIGLDADMDALVIAAENIEAADVEEVMDLVQCDVSSMPLRAAGLPAIDTVVMNPPFGTRNTGIDVAFLEQAIELRPRAIYSLHKTSTRKFLVKKATEEWGLEVEVIAELRFDIPKMYKHHKKKTADVEVDFIRFVLPDSFRTANIEPSNAAAPLPSEDAAEKAPEDDAAVEKLDQIDRTSRPSPPRAAAEPLPPPN